LFDRIVKREKIQSHFSFNNLPYDNMTTFVKLTVFITTKQEQFNTYQQTSMYQLCFIVQWIRCTRLRSLD